MASSATLGFLSAMQFLVGVLLILGVLTAFPVGVAVLALAVSFIVEASVFILTAEGGP